MTVLGFLLSGFAIGMVVGASIICVYMVEGRMHRAQAQVRAFMAAMDQPTPDQIQHEVAKARLAFRLELIREEFEELQRATRVTPGGAYVEYDMRTVTADQIDAICDLLYVTYGLATEMGVDVAPFFDLVHEANMRKADGPVREDGKRLKPPGWKPPDIDGLLQRLLNEARR